MNLRAIIKDDDLIKRLEKIEQVMKEDYLPAWQIHFPHYTDHGASHCESVESKLNEFIPDSIKDELNEYEIFFLLCAVWLHDVGMTSFEKCEDTTREKHHELGRTLIRNDEIKGIHLNEHEKAVKIWETLAEQGDVTSLLKMAKLYTTGFSNKEPKYSHSIVIGEFND